MTCESLRISAVMASFNGDYDSAIRFCTLGIEMAPDLPEFYKSRAAYYQVKNENDAAISDYSFAIQLDPNDAHTFADRSRLYARMGMIAESERDQKSYVAMMTERDPHFPAEDAIRKLCAELDGFEPRNYEKLSVREKAVWNVYWFHAEIMNGGIDQYFFNSAGDHATDCLAALEVIGAKESLRLLQSACELFPNGIPDGDHDVRQQQVRQICGEDRSIDDIVEGEIEQNLFSLLLEYYNASSTNEG